MIVSRRLTRRRPSRLISQDETASRSTRGPGSIPRSASQRSSSTGSGMAGSLARGSHRLGLGHPSRAAGCRLAGLAGIHRRTGAHVAARVVGAPDTLTDADVAADPGAARDDALLADDGDAGVQATRLLAVGRAVVWALADDRALADDDLLVEDRPVDDGAGPDG